MCGVAGFIAKYYIGNERYKDCSVEHFDWIHILSLQKVNDVASCLSVVENRTNIPTVLFNELASILLRSAKVYTRMASRIAFNSLRAAGQYALSFLTVIIANVAYSSTPSTRCSPPECQRVRTTCIYVHRDPKTDSC